MKSLFKVLFILLIPYIVFAADVAIKVKDLPQSGTPTTDDLLLIQDAPATTDATKYVTWGSTQVYLKSYFDGIYTTTYATTNLNGLVDSTHFTNWDLGYTYGTTYNGLKGTYDTAYIYGTTYNGLKAGYDSAVSWGNHALVGYITTYVDNDSAYLTTETDPIWSSVSSNYLTTYANDSTDGYMSSTYIKKYDTSYSSLGHNHNLDTPVGYAEMYMYANSSVCVIDVANTYHAIYTGIGNNDGVLPPLIDTTYFTFKAGAGYTISSFDSLTSSTIAANTSSAHTLLIGEPITITGSTDYDSAYLVYNTTSSTTFVIQKTWTQTRTGSVRRPATFKALIAGKYLTSINFSGSCETVNDIFKWELNKDITPLDNTGVRSIWSTGTNYRSVGSTGLVSLTVGQYLWASIKNYSGAGDVTFYSGNIVIHRLY